MSDSGDNDSDSEINVYKSQKINIIESDEESSSSSSDGESDKCPICITRLGQQDLASPNSCLHTFCLNCLTEWAKNAKTCPIDRLDFKFIIVRNVDGQILQQIDVNHKNEEEKLPSVEEDMTYCQVCNLCNREEEMLLCDVCDCGYHMDCLNPPLYVVPLEEWYCPSCNVEEQNFDIDREEVTDLLNDITEDEQLPRFRQSRLRQQHQRLVPRTRASERVRMNTQRIQQNIMAAEGHTVQGKKAKKYTKRKVRVKKRCKKGKKLVRKKKIQKAERLGLCSSRLSKNYFGGNNSLGTSSNFVDNTSLSIFGNPHELDYASANWSDNERDVGGDGPLHMSAMSRIRISTVDLISRKEISEILRRPVRRNINISNNIDSINILDTILNVQEKQFTKKPIENEMKNVDKHITQTPMYSDHRTDRNSDNFNNYSSSRNNNRNYSKNNDQSYSDVGNSSSYEESQLTNEQNFSENQPVNPFPFRNTGPIKFRMNVTKMGERKQPQTPPPKVITTEYNVEEESGPSSQSETTFKALEPPPEPPALLMGINLDDDDDDDNLVIDDKDYYDPENLSDSDERTKVNKPTGTAYMQSPTYGGYMEQVENQSIPLIPVSNSNNICPVDEVMSSEDDEKETNDDCPNISLYSTTSLKISNSPKEYGPFFEHEMTENDKLNEEAELQYIPMPPVSPERDMLSGNEKCSPKSEENDCVEIIEDSKTSSNEKDKCENSYDDNNDDDDDDDDDDDESISDKKVNDTKELHLAVEPKIIGSKVLENEQLEDLIDIEFQGTGELTNEPNDEVKVDKDKRLFGGATSEVSCATFNGSDNDNQLIEIIDNNLNFDPISDSEEENKTNDQRDKSNSSLRNKKLLNGKKDETISQKETKNKDKKKKVKEKETVPWKKLSKNSKDRNYRYGKGKEKLDEENNRKEKKEKRKEIELYDVRKVLEERPRRKKDKFGRDLSKSSYSDSDSKGGSKHKLRKKRKKTRSKPQRRSLSSNKQKSRKRSRSRYRSESKNKHRSRSRHRSRSPKHLSKHIKGQVTTKERYRSPVLYDEREVSPLFSKRQVKKPKEKTSIYSKIEKDYEKKLLKNDKNSKRKVKKKPKDYQYSSLSPRSLSPGMQVWQSPRDRVSPWSHTDISRTPSPAYTRHAADMDINYSNRDQEFSEYNENIALNNLKVIVKNDNNKKSKLNKRHSIRQIAVSPVKEVFASGDNIMISVNYNKDKTTEQNSMELLKRKWQDKVPVSSSKKLKNTNATDIPVNTATNQKTSTKKGQNLKWKNRKQISRTLEVINSKPVAIIDLNTSPFKEIELSPKSVIVLTDSDEDKQVTKCETKEDNSTEKSKENAVEQKSVEKNENSTQTITSIMIGGPKTPPEPVNPISKPDNISTNSCEFNSQDEELTQTHDVRGRGPNTPPEPPRSVDTVASETAYDPFEPTKSNSPSPPPRIDMFEDDNDNDENDNDDNKDNNDHNDTSTQPLEENKIVDNESSISPQIITKTITPPFLESQSSIQIDKTPSEKLTSNIAIPLLYTSPIATKTPSPTQPTPTIINTEEIINLDDNDDSQTTGFDNGADSPYSPGEGFVDEMKSSSPDSPVPKITNIVSNTLQPQNVNESRSKLDALLSILPRSKPSKENNTTITNLKPLKFSSKPTKHLKKKNSFEDNVDDLPGSAVELESKNKFLEKLNRQERVIEEVKLVLKPHYNKKHITKEQYKDIMRKAVPKICHNKSGEINPQKIHSLIEAYVIKYRHSHRKQVQRISSI